MNLCCRNGPNRIAKTWCKFCTMETVNMRTRSGVTWSIFKNIISYYRAIILIQWETFIYDMWAYNIFPVLYNRKSYFSNWISLKIRIISYCVFTSDITCDFVCRSTLFVLAINKHLTTSCNVSCSTTFHLFFVVQ